MLFVVLWLAGDVFNVLGAVLQHVLPTMIILALYYTAADLVLLGQIYLYGDGSQVDPVHLSPANPLSENILEEVIEDVLGETSPLLTNDSEANVASATAGNAHTQPKLKKSARRSFIEGMLITLVIVSGLVGWFVSYDPDSNAGEPDMTFDPLAQFFGWLSAVLYLGSRLPQILLNYKRKSCEGISFLFFLCAVLGNVTYVISILAISVDPHFLLVQSSWLAGSIGTLALDFIIFIQFFLYNSDDDDSSSDSD